VRFHNNALGPLAIFSSQLGHDFCYTRFLSAPSLPLHVYQMEPGTSSKRNATLIAAKPLACPSGGLPKSAPVRQLKYQKEPIYGTALSPLSPSFSAGVAVARFQNSELWDEKIEFAPRAPKSFPPRFQDDASPRSRSQSSTSTIRYRKFDTPYGGS
jgi:hypothetical protein